MWIDRGESESGHPANWIAPEPVRVRTNRIVLAVRYKKHARSPDEVKAMEPVLRAVRNHNAGRPSPFRSTKGFTR